VKKNTLVGISAAVACVLLALMLDHDNLFVLLNPTALVLVLGGTGSLAVAVGTFEEARSLPKIAKKAVLGVPEDPARTVQQLVEMAALARKEGLLSLEAAAKEEPDPFFRQGIGLVVDGKDAETIRAALENGLEAAAARHAQRAQIFKQAGGFAPTLGIIGTVVGLVHVMTDISSPQTLGPAIGAAFTATLWGVLSANLLWHPMAAKLQRLSEAEVVARQAVIEGLLAIQAGERPSAVQSLLAPYLTIGGPEARVAEAQVAPEEEAGAA
jgi:chemotaxis protein MotA